MPLFVSSDDMREWFDFDDGIRDEELKADYNYRLLTKTRGDGNDCWFQLSWKFDEDQPYVDTDDVPNQIEFQKHTAKWSSYKNINTSSPFAMMMCEWDTDEDDDDDDDNDDE